MPDADPVCCDPGGENAESSCRRPGDRSIESMPKVTWKTRPGGFIFMRGPGLSALTYHLEPLSPNPATSEAHHL